MSDDVTHITVLFNEAFEAILSKALAEEHKQNMQAMLNSDAGLHAVDRSHFVKRSTNIPDSFDGKDFYGWKHMVPECSVSPFISHFFLLHQALILLFMCDTCYMLTLLDIHACFDGLNCCYFYCHAIHHD